MQVSQKQSLASKLQFNAPMRRPWSRGGTDPLFVVAGGRAVKCGASRRALVVKGAVATEAPVSTTATPHTTQPYGVFRLSYDVANVSTGTTCTRRALFVAHMAHGL